MNVEVQYVALCSYTANRSEKRQLIAFFSVSANSSVEMETSYKWLNAAIEQTDVCGVFRPQEQTKHKNTLKKQSLIRLYT